MLEKYSSTIRIWIFFCISCGYNVIKRKQQLSKIQRKRINFIERLKYAEHKKFGVCLDVCKIDESDDYDKICKVLSTLKKDKNKQYLNRKI